jgi:hypothetical protein
MGLARVVTFEGVDTDRIDQLRKDMAEGEPPEGLPAKEGIVLHDAENGKAMAILFFDNEDDYQQGDATLNAMPAADTPGRRTSVTKYEVAIRMTA